MEEKRETEARKKKREPRTRRFESKNWETTKERGG